MRWLSRQRSKRNWASLCISSTCEENLEGGSGEAERGAWAASSSSKGIWKGLSTGLGSSRIDRASRTVPSMWEGPCHSRLPLEQGLWAGEVGQGHAIYLENEQAEFTYHVDKVESLFGEHLDSAWASTGKITTSEAMKAGHGMLDPGSTRTMGSIRAIECVRQASLESQKKDNVLSVDLSEQPRSGSLIQKAPSVAPLA